MNNKLTEIISILSELSYKSNDLSYRVNGKKHFTNEELINFPGYVDEILEKIINDLESYSENQEDCLDVNDKIEDYNVLNISLKENSKEDFYFQFMDNDFSDELNIPEEYRNCTVALVKYKADITYCDNKNQQITKTQDFYELCLDPGKDKNLSSTDCWNMVDDSDIVYSNSHCNIYKISENWFK